MIAMLVCIVLSFLFAVILTPLVRRICIRRSKFDSPGPLKIHSQPTPRLGGVAIFLALFVSLAIASPLGISGRSLWLFLAAASLVWLAGFIDDLRNLSPAIRVVAQVSAAALLWQGGWRLPWLDSGAVGFAALAVFVVVFVNAFNFLDGADGIAAGTAVIIGLAFLARLHANAGSLGAFVALALLGSCLGFLPFNLPSARIFMGDSGSNVLGFAIAFLSLDFYRANAHTPEFAAFPIVAAGLPLLDAVLAVVRRLKLGRSPFFGDRSHIYDLMAAHGWSPRVVVLACTAFTAALCIVARASLLLSAPLAIFADAAAFAVLLGMSLRLGSLRTDAEFERLQEAQTEGSPHRV
ncbi:MAG TPA: MraY family glycosyltransferase [Candidatus Acidoferrales bacterium]|nr:MraY family glycosyltransferase [Candidatus Acidoferrales bacterium]